MRYGYNELKRLQVHPETAMREQLSMKVHADLFIQKTINIQLQLIQLDMNDCHYGKDNEHVKTSLEHFESSCYRKT